ncbi:MAG: Na/Pi cotransporter family protein, partial [Desulfuromonadales bacterium]
NIGTTVTPQLIAFNITNFALPANGFGAGLKLFARSRKWVYAGEILLGFGILFFGLSVMKNTFEPIKGSAEIRHLFLIIGNNHLLGVLIGALITILVQSSSATIGITLALASTGLLTFDASVALILGENIGTTITANLAAIGTNLAARRTALAHFLFNVIGVAYMLVFFPYFIELVDKITSLGGVGPADFVVHTQAQAAALGAASGDKPFIARHIANCHTLFNIINTIIFLPLIGLLAKLTTLLIRGKEEEMEFHLKFIDNRVLNTPPIALGQARSETRRMAQVSLEMLDETIGFLEDQDEKRLAVLARKEEMVDMLQKEITDFLVALSQKSITPETSKDIASMMHIVNDLERVGDHCENLWNLGMRKKNEKVVFSEVAMNEIRELGEKTKEFLAFMISALERRDGSIGEKADFMETDIDHLEEISRNNHIARLNTGECAVQPGLIFIDMLHNFVNIGDHTFNLAKAIVGAE